MMLRLSIVFLFFSFATIGQKEVELQFQFYFQDQVLSEDVWYVTQLGDSIQIDKVIFFVSVPVEKQKDIQLENVHLVDWSDTSTHHWKTSLSRKGELGFTLGLDSIYHVSSIMDGDLNPAKGMYWAWQSGYIQFKVEGRSPSCGTRKNKFQYHLGGYLKSFDVAQTVNFGQLEVSNASIKVDLFEFFQGLDVEKTPEIMIPGKEAVKQMKVATQILSIQGLF